MVEKAEAFAKKAHEGQVDKSGKPYFGHPKAVAAMVEGEVEKTVAYLHDVVEDTGVTIDQIRSLFGDEVADAIAEKFGLYLGRALAAFACVTDPEIYVIGGGVSKAGPVILDYVQKYYRQYAFPGCKDAAFALATLGNDAGIYGAAKVVL